MEELIRLALFCGFAALLVGVALRQLQRIRRIHRRYSDPARIARLLADDPPGDERRGAGDAGRAGRDDGGRA